MEKWFESNTVLKLLALGLAITLWMSVNGKTLPLPTEDESFTTIRNVTLEAQYDQERMDLTDAPKTVNLKLRGNLFALDHLNPDEYHAYVDLRHMGPGTHRNVPVKVRGLPSGIEVEVEPSQVDVTLELKEQKEMPVQVDLVGTPAPGYKAGKPIVSPTRVLIRGSASLLDQVTAVKAVVNVDGATETVSKSVTLQVYGEEGPLNQAEVLPRPVVDVEVPVASPNAEIPLNVGINKYPPLGYAVSQLTMNVDKVTVYGPAEYIQGLEVYPGPKLDLSRTKKNDTFEIPIPLVNGVAKVEPKTVRISVKIVPAQARTLTNLPVEVSGLSEGLNSQVITPSGGKLYMTVTGAPDLIRNLKTGDLRAYVDVARLPPGIYARPIQVKLPPFVRLQHDQVLMATVRLSK
jgi:YbbR domain-containing protein